MIDYTYVLAVAVFVVILASLKYLPWYLQYCKTSARIARAKQQSLNATLSVYRARHDNQLIMGELYISKDRIRFEKAGRNIFDLTPRNIQKVIHNKRTVQFVFKDGSRHRLRYLRPEVSKEGAIDYTVMYGVAYNDADAINDLLGKLRSLGISIVEGSTGSQPAYFYIGVACAVFVFSVLSFVVVDRLIR